MHAQVQAFTTPAERLNTQPAPVVIIGNGPVGMHAAREILKRQPDTWLVIYGSERYHPYNRVKLSSMLSGELNWEALLDHLHKPEKARVEERIGFTITHIDTEAQFVEDEHGARQPYRKLILATGSRPHIPNIPGIDLSGVFTFRNLDDTASLMARQVRTQHTVVLGGGLLGLEAARGMQRGHTQVTVIEHADRLLGNMLDEAASTELQLRLKKLGIKTTIRDSVTEILGGPRVSGIKLRSGRIIDCDTVVVATGIRPNIDLARATGIAFGKGIRVDDNMLTSAANVYAIGECAEHRGKVYGLVAPGLEQATVAASHIDGQTGHYRGSILATRLKVVGCPVFSAGPVDATARPNYGTSYVYRDISQGIYRKLLVHRHRLIGIIGVGEWAEATRALNTTNNKQWLWPWQLWRFKKSGNLWPEEQATSVCQWPASAPVCQCTGVSRGAIGEAIHCGAKTVTEVSKATGAASVCGSCRPLVQELIGLATPQPVTWSNLLGGLAIVSLLAALSVLLFPAIPYADSVQMPWRWDELWRDNLLKQISGYGVLALFAIGLLVSPRKRSKKLQSLGSFDAWRLSHIILGLLVVVGLLIHTGLRLGNGLNLLLMVSFSATLLLGAVVTAIIAQEHRLGANATWLRRKTVWWHILLFWPVPVVLGLHILKSYYF